jgi:hypothetical protein
MDRAATTPCDRQWSGLLKSPAAQRTFEGARAGCYNRVMRSFGALALVLAMAALAVPGAAAAAPTLSVDVLGPGEHAISPDIYGMNFADPTLAAQVGLPVDRFGGDSIETYNYLNSAVNTAQDYYYENIAGCFDVTDCSTPVFPDRDQIAADRADGAASLIQLPLMGYVAKDAPTQHPFTCGFPKTVFSTQDSFDPFDANCGNGMSGHARLDPQTPTRDGLAIDGSWDGAEVAADVARYGTAGQGGVRFYELGNEPALWSSTHDDMHHADETNSELISKFTAAALAVRAADPSAEIVGPSEWGWINYFCDSATFNAGTCHPPQSGSAGPSTPVVAAFLDAMHAYQQAHGVKLLDDFDLHYYPAGGSASDTTITRSLWDPAYTDPSYIDTPIDLIPRMHQWVADHDPGVSISLSEYNFDLGGGDTVDTLTEADALGIFAREDLDMATEWAPPHAGDPEAAAYRLYRDYDGHGARFGDVYESSASSDQDQLAVYGALRSSDGAMTVAVINKSSGALSSALALPSFGVGGPAQVWQATAPGFVFARQPDVATAFQSTAAIAFPAQSLTMVVIPQITKAPPPGTGPGAPGTAVPGTNPPGENAPTARATAKPRCVVPKLANHTEAGARALLVRAHCALGTVHHVASRHPRGRVVRQSLTAKSTHLAGAHVSVWLSRGRAARTSPRRVVRAG